MAVYAKVTKVLTTDFADVVIMEDGVATDEHYVAEFKGSDLKVKYGDIVEMVPTENRIMNESRIAYVLPVIGVIFGILVTGGRDWGERVLAAILLGLMLFIVAWIMNRRSRMLKRREFKITRIVKKNPHNLNL